MHLFVNSKISNFINLAGLKSFDYNEDDNNLKWVYLNFSFTKFERERDFIFVAKLIETTKYIEKILSVRQ